MRQLVRARRSSRAFTLVELLAVVTIVTIIAALGLVALRDRVFGSKATEALAMVQSIRSAEERWKSENLLYLDVSQSGLWFPADPTADAKATKRSFYVPAASHPDAKLWASLRPVAPGPVQFGYMVNAGQPLAAMKTPAMGGVTWPPPCDATTSPPACNGDPWYVIQAIADLDHDGIKAYFLASHIKADIFRLNEGE
jgi:prepilin-type N-terminal cleavage/methylation domain-containing protein